MVTVAKACGAPKAVPFSKGKYTMYYGLKVLELFVEKLCCERIIPRSL